MSMAQLVAGKQARLAIDALSQESASLRHKPSVDLSIPLFLENREILPKVWNLGDTVQCFDGRRLKRVSVEPYMLARGAAARGPLEVVKLMQRHGSNLEVVYFSLTAISKFEFRENDDGLCTREAKVCILQTLKTLNRHAAEPAIVAAAHAALVSLAENYAARAVIDKEDWSHLVVAAMHNVVFEYHEPSVRHADDDESRPEEVRIATHQSCDIAANGCRLFAAMASDPKLREVYAEDAIKSCVAVMRDCGDDATVQACACLCLYNYVYRCELASMIAEDANVLALVEAAMDRFPSDTAFMAYAARAHKALQPDGWRGVEE